jgi:hypothetical protein
MVSMDYDKEIRDLKRRTDLTETKPAQQAGQFEFITGQLRDIQLYMHARFSEMDEKIGAVDRKVDQLGGKVDSIERKVDALPRVIAEMIGPRG